MFITAMHCSSITSELLLYSNAFFAGCYGYPEHDLPASRVPVSAEGCGEVAALCLIGRF